jgi:replicative DNA helicase
MVSGVDSREQQVVAVTRELKALALRLRVVVLALCQVSRQCDARADPRPTLSDMRESGAIEADADVVIALYHAASYKADANPEETEVFVLKQRQGPTGTIKLRWHGPTTTFSDQARTP